MTKSYDEDVVAWSIEQAQIIRTGQFELLDREHVADEIEDVGRAEKREFEKRLSLLLAHLMIWLHEPERQSKDFASSIRLDRKHVAYHLKDKPSLQTCFADDDWLKMVWASSIVKAIAEVWASDLPDSIGEFPEICPWSMVDVMAQGWLPQIWTGRDM